MGAKPQRHSAPPRIKMTQARSPQSTKTCVISHAFSSQFTLKLFRKGAQTHNRAG